MRLIIYAICVLLTISVYCQKKLVGVSLNSIFAINEDGADLKS